MSGRRAERRLEGRSRILKAAQTLFEAEGVVGLSVRAIAKGAGMPVMTLYSYFPSKTAIVRALWAEAIAPLRRALDAAEASETLPALQLRAVARAFVGYWLTYPDRYRVVFLIEDRRERDGDKWFIEETDALADLLRTVHLIAAVKGDPGGDYLREGEALVCALIGISHLLIGMTEYPWASSEAYIDLILKAFL